MFIQDIQEKKTYTKTPAAFYCIYFLAGLNSPKSMLPQPCHNTFPFHIFKNIYLSLWTLYDLKLLQKCVCLFPF